jgi:hypothetical protein
MQISALRRLVACELSSDRGRLRAGLCTDLIFFARQLIWDVRFRVRTFRDVEHPGQHRRNSRRIAGAPRKGSPANCLFRGAIGRRLCVPGRRVVATIYRSAQFTGRDVT